MIFSFRKLIRLNKHVNKAANSGEVAIGIMILSGLILMLIAGTVTTQYLKTKVLLSATEVAKNFTFTTPHDQALIGEHTINFTVTDGTDAFTSDPVTVVVTASNQPPVVSAGNDLTIQMPLETTLSGTATDDGLPNSLEQITTQWSKTSGPGDVSFGNTAALETTVSFSSAGTYILKLTANDGKASAYDELTATVNPAPLTPDLSLQTDKSLLTINDTVIVNVNMTTATPFANWGQYLEFDNTKLELIDQQEGDFSTFITDTRGLNAINYSGQVRTGGFNLTNSNNGTGRLGIFTFKAIGEGQTTVTTTNKSSNNLFGNAISEINSYEISPNIITKEVPFTIMPENTTPVGENDSYEAWQAEELVVTAPGVLANDTDDDSDPLTATLATDVSEGGLLLNENGSFTYTSASNFRGLDSFTYQVTDGKSSSPEITVDITVNVRNTAPQVNAGNDQLIEFLSGTTLAGNVIDDGEPLGETLTLLWTKVSGPGVVTFGNSDLPVTIVNFSKAGLYTLRLLANDGELTAYDEMKVIVNTVPVSINDSFSALRGQLLSVRAPGVLINDTDADGDTLGAELASDTQLGNLILKNDGSFTYIYDPGEDACRFVSEQISTPISCDDPNCTDGPCKKSAPWQDSFTYVATDGKGQSDTTTVDITINVTNTAPVVNAGEDQIIAITEEATLNGTVMDDALPDPPSTTTTQWLMISGPGSVTINNADQKEATAQFTQPGKYTLRLSANDGEFLSADEVIIEVNSAPLVEAGENITILLNEDIELTGLISDDGIPTDPGIFIVQWSQISGPATAVIDNVLSANTLATFSVPGEYILRLTANDSHLTAFDEITIIAVAKYAEVVIPGQTRYNVRPGETIEIPFEVKTNIIDIGRLLITMTKNIYFSTIE